jgi:acetylornithine/N-succinyldiaminopimelate aminotransferase
MTDLTALIATRFKEDPRIKQAKDLIINTLQEYQKKLTGVQPPQTARVHSYQELLKTFSEIRGGPLYFPYIGSGLGKGPLVELLDGSVKYDLISGIGPHYWGHHDPELTRLVIDAALGDTIMQGHLQQNLEALTLSQLLLEASHLDHCFLSSTGVMANENALKLAFQHNYPANRILAFEKCFMGRTLTLSQITDKPSFREGLPLQIGVDYIPFYDPQSPQESTQQAVTALKNHLARYPKQHAVMCFELVQGEGGFNVGTHEFFVALMTILKAHGIAIFIDEVQTFGRTSRLFAYQHFQLDDYVDLVSIGKLSQTCATLFRSTFKPKPGLLSQTFTSSSTALQASPWIIQQLLEGDYFGPTGKIMQLHAHFVKHFERLGTLKGPYGIGAMIAFTPFNGEAQKVIPFVQDLFHAGVISFVAGSQPTRVRFLIPAGVLTLQDVDEVMKIVEQVLRKSEEVS